MRDEKKTIIVKKRKLDGLKKGKITFCQRSRMARERLDYFCKIQEGGKDYKSR